MLKNKEKFLKNCLTRLFRVDIIPIKVMGLVGITMYQLEG
jgi:hypothetical protein